MSEKNPSQIIRKDMRLPNAQTGFFVEVTNTMLDNGKIIFNFVEYDAKTFKQIRLIPIYIDTQKFLAFCLSVMNREVRYTLEEEKKKLLASGANSFPTGITITQGGTKKEKAKRPSGKDEARVMKIIPATKSKTANLMLQAERGDGEEQGTGIIVPKFDYKNPATYERINIPLSYADLNEIVTSCWMMIQAHYTSNYAKGKYKYVPPTPQQ